ncbi:MAG: Eco57I restriction-modification methylase domain-containing protein [Pontiellaceae bacterium]|nr:Eco57I restriction-modification methylase domain-containing protein [Pontiellaceae bacterium]
MSDLKRTVEEKLKRFQALELRSAALDLLGTLGYRSEKTVDFGGSPDAFLAQFDSANTLRKDKALFDDWREIHLLFQLTTEELSGELSLFAETDVKQGMMNSYLFFALKLKGEAYPRGKLAQIARQLNRLFPMPVMVLFEYDQKLSIAVINRRRSKHDESQDVLGKVTLIQEISLGDPHRGHLDILSSFALPTLAGKTGIRSFDALHAAWEEVFNVELLNKRFYRELANWYFWAMQHVHFPFDILEFELHELNKGDLFKDKEKLREHDAKNLIRLLTRLLFVWFIKEKGLIPEPLFEKQELENNWLAKFDAKSKETRYYKAILQNLFFAALNQPVEKREFRKEGRQHRNITNLMRYESFFQDPEAFVVLLKSIVPFMNGGLFECLDRPHPTLKGPQDGDVILYEDGFSDRKDNQLQVPDFLFFGDRQDIDLSDVYGDAKRKKETVRGIIPILNNYKFTIVENTPIEQEIALDPELLGKVFENLLASYNPETKTTARKQTGSFYTPRTIVDYMVDQSLKAYLKKNLTTERTETQSSSNLCASVSSSEAGGKNNSLMSDADAEEGLEILFAYTEKEHAFTDEEKLALIQAIDTCKILDPACGSGAFPMGILHKLEFVLGKLDPQNKLWRDRQLEKVDATIAAAEQIDDTTIRENTIADLEAQKQDIEESFANNELGYGRKLYLIENCIYGVDIQAIATQVSRLRFFISLIVDQKVNASKDNFGIRPLPNLEAKFATADTLIQIEKPAAQLNLFDSKEVQNLEAELKQVRHKMFGAKTPGTKKKYRDRDKELREQIAAELQKNGWSNASARQLANWDPYDQNATCTFFDPEWMFDLKGFDIVIGNPPYVQIQKFPKEVKDKWITQNFQTYAATADIYCLFYERGAQLLNKCGHLCYITSNKWMRAGYGDKLRGFLSGSVDTIQVLDFGMAQNFGAATTYTNILGFENSKPRKQTRCCYVSDDRAAMADPESYFNQNAVKMPDLDANAWVVCSPERYKIKQTVEAQGIPLEEWDINIYRGVLTGLNDAFYLTQEQRDELVAKEPQAEEIIVPLLRGRYVERYKTNWDQTWMIRTFPTLGIKLGEYPEIKKHLQQFRTRLEPKPKDHSGKWDGRKAGSYQWFETQDTIGYHQEFRKPKIIYQEIAVSMPFYYDTEEYFMDTTCFMMTSETESLPYLTAVFNSSLFRCCFKNNFPEYSGNASRMKKVFFDKIPIRKPTESEAELFEQLVAMVQTAKKVDHASRLIEHKRDACATFLEELIDACVLELYFPEEALEKDLQFITDTAICLEKTIGSVSEASIREFIEHCTARKIGDKLARLESSSPDLFAVIKQEGKV